MWASLSSYWQAALAEAWAAYCAGSVPIGAVIADANGQIIARGRNHIGDDGAAPVARHELAHAELNALLSLSFTDDDLERVDPRTWALYTTMEPCPLCMGAFYMSGIRQLHYAARDPWAGSVNLLNTTPYLSRKPIHATGPEDAALETLCVGLLMEFTLRGALERLRPWIEGHWRPVVPEGVRLGERLLETGALQDCRRRGASVEAMVATVGAARERTSA
jgi:tRNA(Arg) A34 adenosine deaminase TadA